MVVAQWAVVGLTAVAAGLASYFYNDGRDHHLQLVLLAAAVIGVVGTGLFFLAETLTPAASAVPQCNWADLGDDLSPNCESTAEASKRAAHESLDHFMSNYVFGPAIEGAATLGGAVAGFIAAMATSRKPSDGRPRRMVVDGE